jgi:cob(I)alamin adenosyltransferase
MGNRLSKIYTKTGDQGTTGLGDGERIGKTEPRVEAMGDIDELNSLFGVLICDLEDTDARQSLMKDELLLIQHDLFDLGGELSIPGSSLLPGDAVERIESMIDKYNEPLPALKEFILPGGSKAAAHCHLARAVCRRAERRVVGLNLDADVGQTALKYINRLSDLLFVLARVISRIDGGQEINWDRSRFEV